MEKVHLRNSKRTAKPLEEMSTCSTPSGPSDEALKQIKTSKTDLIDHNVEPCRNENDRFRNDSKVPEKRRKIGGVGDLFQEHMSSEMNLQPAKEPNFNSVERKNYVPKSSHKYEHVDVEADSGNKYNTQEDFQNLQDEFVDKDASNCEDNSSQALELDPLGENIIKGEIIAVGKKNMENVGVEPEVEDEMEVPLLPVARNYCSEWVSNMANPEPEESFWSESETTNYRDHFDKPNVKAQPTQDYDVAEEPLDLNCPRCDKQFSDLHSLNAHMAKMLPLCIMKSGTKLCSCCVFVMNGNFFVIVMMIFESVFMAQD